MKSIAKKVIIFSMVGLLQIGFGASVIEASPLHNDLPPIQQQYDRYDRGQDRPGEEQRERKEKERHERQERERHDREQQENRRHEQEMRRHPGEGEREWQERQQRENERHDEAMKQIAHAILDLVCDN